jgi:hypothetical protein
VEQVTFHPIISALATIRKGGGFRILVEHSECAATSETTVVLQTGLNSVVVAPLVAGALGAGNSSIPITGTLKLQGLHTSGHHVLVYSTTQAAVYSYRDTIGAPPMVAQFSHSAESLYIHSAGVVQVTHAEILICSLAGKVVQSIHLVPEELQKEAETMLGTVSAMNGVFVAALTKSGWLTVVDAVNSTEVQHLQNLSIQGHMIHRIAISCDGLHVAIAASQENGTSVLLVHAKGCSQVHSCILKHVCRHLIDLLDSFHN